MLESEEYSSQTALGQKLGVSRARVNQDARGDPLYSRDVTERKLRPIVTLSEDKQAIMLKNIL